MQWIDLDIVRGKLRAVIDEMATVLVQTSLSPVINEILDFSCCICDADGRLVALSNGITILTGTISSQLQAIRRKFGSTIRPGDVFISNDPYEGNTHTSDITHVKPLFFDGELVCFTTVTAHCNDLGGAVAGSLSPDASDIFQEGLRIPALRVVREGVRQDILYELIASNVRLPKMTVADLSAQLAVVRLGDARLRELCENYGADQLRASFERALDAGEAMSRAAIGRLPDGNYLARDYIDGDGNCADRLPIQVRLIISGDKIRADFSGSCQQRAAPINCTRGVLEAAVKAALIAVVEPGAAMNDGWFRPLTVAAPEGTVFTAEYPAPTGWCYEAASHATDLIWKALAQAVPERLSAGGYTSLCATYFGGRTANGTSSFVLVEPHVGGWGAMSDADGANALIAAADGHTYNHPVELIEAKHPIRINRYALNIDEHAGAGTFRGGLGVVREYEVLADNVFFYTSIGRSQTPPWGLEGGEPGCVNYVEIDSRGRTTRSARVPFCILRVGDRVRVVTGHGGGYGDPLARSPLRVLSDVRDGYIDAATAKATYGVILVTARDGAPLTVDMDATLALRGNGGSVWGR
jgi:N-methylhydantoinase B